jgi:hypothetical protein
MLTDEIFEHRVHEVSLIKNISFYGMTIENTDESIDNLCSFNGMFPKDIFKDPSDKFDRYVHFVRKLRGI